MEQDRHIQGRRVQVMGIVNLTGDSYYAPSRHLDETGKVDLETTKRDISKMLDEGADIIDLGACSSRPGSTPITADEEWRRLKPVLEMIKNEFQGTAISIDTCWATVVRKAFKAISDTNTLIINDISAGLKDPDMLSTVGKRGLEYIAMHNAGAADTPASYPNGVVQSEIAFFEGFAARAEKSGIKDWILDPGFGFSKTLSENWELLENLHLLKRSYGQHTPQILVGISRKSMIYKKFGITPEESLPATCDAHRLAIAQGADILRVHDVAPAIRILRESLA